MELVKSRRHSYRRGVEELGFNSEVLPPGNLGFSLDFFPRFPPYRAHVGLEWGGRSVRWELGAFQGAVVKRPSK